MRWKWILGIAAGVLLALFVTVFVIIATYDFNKLKPRIRDAVMTVTGRNLKIDGDIGLKIGLRPILTAERVSFQNAPWGSRPDLATMKKLEVQAALIPLIKGIVQVNRLILIEPDLLIETSRSGKSNLEFEAPKKADPAQQKEVPSAGEPAKMPSLAIDELRIEKGLLTYKDDRSGKVYAFKVNEFSAAVPDEESPIKLKMKAAYGNVPLEMTGVLGSLKGLSISDKDWPVKISAESVDSKITIDGTVKNPKEFRGFNFNLTATGKDVASLSAFTGKPLPLQGPFGLSGRISDPAPRTIRAADVKLTFAGGDLTGTLDVNLAGDRPRISASLSSQKLNINPFLEPASPPATGGKGQPNPKNPPVRRERIFSDAPLRLDMLKKFDATLKYQAGELLLPQLPLSNLNLEMTLKDGALRVKPMKASMSGGTVSTSFDLQPQGQNLALNAVLNVVRVDLGNLLKSFKTTEALKGNINLDADLKMRGNSLAAWMAGLDGKMVLTMEKGEIQNKYLDLLGGEFVKNILRFINPLRQEKEETPIHCFVSGLAIKDGHAETTALVIDSDYMTVIGDGTINLKNETLNLGFKPLPKEDLGKRLASRLGVSLGELARSFKVSGSLAHPSVGIDPTETAVTLGKRLSRMDAGGAAKTPETMPENLCTTALDAAKKGVKFAELEKTERKRAVPIPETPEDVRKTIKEFGKELKKFFRE
jgi:hypothetical protein